MEVNFDFIYAMGDNPLQAAWWLLVHGGFLAFLVPFLVTAWEMWIFNKRHEYIHNIKWVLLAIDVPKTTEQSPLAVEQIFATVSSIRIDGTLYERFWKGKVIDSCSFELVSLGGYIQFLIRTPVDFRDLIEASIYAQYPDAEITEVDDYVNRISMDFDSNTHDLWGTEFQFLKPNVYPIRTYLDFEKMLAEEFKDPMAALLEVMSRIGPQEDVWLQLVLTPADDHWKHEAYHEIKKLIEGKSHSKKGFLYKLLFDWPLDTLEWLGEQIIPLWGHVEEEKIKEELGTVQKLTPGQKKVLEAMERKLSKLAFYTKFRMIYWGARETFLKGRGVSAVVGAIQQFTVSDMNGLVPGKRITTKAEYFLKESRLDHKQRSMLYSYKNRDTHRGLGHGVVLNIEELATIYHFPVTTVKAPLVKKTEAKKSEPPVALPVFGSGNYLRPVQDNAYATGGAGKTGGVPANLPFVE